MRNEWNPIATVAWSLVVVSALLLAVALGLLVSSITTTPEWSFTLFEAIGCALAALSLVGLFSGIGLLRRARLARYSAMATLSLAAAYWALSTFNLFFALVSNANAFFLELASHPVPNIGVCLISLFGLAWCIYSVRVLRSPEARHALGA